MARLATTDSGGSVRIDAGAVRLAGELVVPAGARGLVLFAHGSGSSRTSPRNRRVASALERAGLATLLFDLLTEEEAIRDEITREWRFDVALLGRRLLGAARWALEDDATRGLPLGFFGASTGAAAALIAAAALGRRVAAVVSRGGRPDLAGDALPLVRAPTLLIVGGLDEEVLELNEEAARRIEAEKRVEVVAGATHLFEEPGTLDEVARLAADWFLAHLSPPEAPRETGP
jgi:predicted alpha/beta-hydrolase family hydrolase